MPKIRLRRASSRTSSARGVEERPGVFVPSQPHCQSVRLVIACVGKAFLVHPAEEAGSWSGGRRLVYRACYLVLLASGRAAAHLAADFRALAAAGDRFGPLRILLQLPVLACWAFVRPISLAAFAACCALAPPGLRQPSA